MNRTTLLALGACALLGVTSSAYAGGFFADTFVKPFNPDLAKKLDDDHAKLGRPMDHAAIAAVGGAVAAATGNPAAGAATTAALEVRTNTPR